MSVDCFFWVYPIVGIPSEITKGFRAVIHIAPLNNLGYNKNMIEELRETFLMGVMIDIENRRSWLFRRYGELSGEEAMDERLNNLYLNAEKLLNPLT